MNTKYTVKNFRVFDENGVTVNIKPITILTGCNSSGKSSIVKSMVLLDTYIKSLLEDFKAFNRIELTKHKLDFGQDTTFSLGNFNRVLHYGADDKTITFQYTVHSLLLGEDVVVSLVFGTDDSDELHEGYLIEITISKERGDVIYSSSKSKPLSANYSLIRDNFFRFVYGQFLVDLQHEYKEQHFGLYGLRTREEFCQDLDKLPKDWRKRDIAREENLDAFKRNIDNYFSSFVASYGENVLCDIEKLKTNVQNGDLIKKNDDSLIVQRAGGHPEIVDVSLRWNTLFYFPLLEKLYNYDKASFKPALLSMLGGTQEKEVIYAIDKISEDFTNSGCNTFGDYFKEKEVAFLIFSPQKVKNTTPYICGRELFNFDREGSTYLDWTRRMLGPGIGETPMGPISMRRIGEYDEWKTYPVNFSMLYSVMMNINNMIDSTDSNFFYKRKNIFAEHYFDFQHRVFDTFVDYASLVLREVITSAIPQNLSYVGTSLVSVKRDYSLDSNDSFTNLVKRYFSARKAYKSSPKNILGSDNFISRWIQKFGLGDAVGCDMNESGSSFTVRLYKDAEDNTGSLLAEEGYGVTQLVTLLLRIETAILESVPTSLYNDEKEEVVTPKFSESTIAVEEPEVHLHPKFQSMLAEMFVEAYKKYNVHFIIETHSEYLIRKLQTLVAEKEICNSDTSIIYVYDSDIAKRPLYTPQLKEIEIGEDGRLTDSFGTGFFDEADNLVINLLNQKIAKDGGNS